MCWRYFDLQPARDIFEAEITKRYVHDAENLKVVNCAIGLVRIGAQLGRYALDAMLKQMT